MLSPNHHVRTIVELLRSAGPDLGRRWMSALISIPESDRSAVIQAVEARVAALYPLNAQLHAEQPRLSAPTPTPGPDTRDREFIVVSPPRSLGTHTETIERAYERVEPKPNAKTQRRAASRRHA